MSDMTLRSIQGGSLSWRPNAQQYLQGRKAVVGPGTWHWFEHRLAHERVAGPSVNDLALKLNRDEAARANSGNRPTSLLSLELCARYGALRDLLGTLPKTRSFHILVQMYNSLHG